MPLEEDLPDVSWPASPKMSRAELHGLVDRLNIINHFLRKENARLADMNTRLTLQLTAPALPVAEWRGYSYGQLITWNEPSTVMWPPSIPRAVCFLGVDRLDRPIIQMRDDTGEVKPVDWTQLTPNS